MNCPTCNSNAPHLHPAMQFEGEVETCIDDFHLRVTPQNTEAYRQQVLDKKAEQASALEKRLPRC